MAVVSEIEPAHKYNALSLTVMSALLSENGEASLDEVCSRLESEGVRRTRVTDCIGKTLRKNDMVRLEEEMVSACENGVDYVAENIAKLEDAAKKAASAREVFAPARYKIVALLEREVDAGGWLFDSCGNGEAIKHVAEQIGERPDTVQPRLVDCRDQGFVEVQRTLLPGRRAVIIANLRLTGLGKTWLGAVRTAFPDKVAELESAALTVPDISECSHDDLLEIAHAMTEEVNHMHEELGEPAEDFESILSQDDSSVQMLVRRVRSTMEQLEKRLDSPRQNTAATLSQAV